jgi:hypothetical protein
MEYTKIKFSELPEGVGFWPEDSWHGGDPGVERVIKDGVVVWMDGTKQAITQKDPNDTIYIRKEVPMKDLQAQLEQAKKDKKLSAATLDKEIARIEQQIAESEEVYSVGDRFRHNGKEKFHLVCTDAGCGIISLKTGVEYGTGFVVVDNCIKITKKELESMGAGFSSLTRYFDYQKDRKK